jgi:plastocyanin
MVNADGGTFYAQVIGVYRGPGAFKRDKLPGATSSSAREGSSPDGAVHVTIEGYSFKPATVTVPAGTTIAWKNLDDDPHTVTANDGSFDSKGLAQGDSWSRAFDKPGRYTYHCAIHPVMQGVVVVRSQSDGS